jgi:hypothetical protein
LINRRIRGLRGIHCIDAGNVALKCVVSHRSIKVKEIYLYPSDDHEIVADNRLTPAQEKLADCVVMMGLWPQICKTGKGYIVNKLPCIDRAIT